MNRHPVSSSREFSGLFKRASGLDQPHPWQIDLALGQEGCSNRLIRVPTGFGKTLGALAAWLFNALQREDERWPRRLVWVLPMRVLVEQTEHEIRNALQALNLLWEEESEESHVGKVGVHVLMGGIDAQEWYLYPEGFSVLIATQDMALSRSMNRGYGTPRARWPAEFGLLNQDCLWVLDEVQLMDVGLATSAQLQAFRDDDSASKRNFRPSYSWWMSATLQPGWLAESPDTKSLCADLPALRIPSEQRIGHLWDDVSKPCRLESVEDDKALATLVAKCHAECGEGSNGPTLVVVNRVDRAVRVYDELKNNKTLGKADIRLVHSRFRSNERKTWSEEFLNRHACVRGTNRIIVATQVVEAGVNVSSALLITELAPWASLVQRFGRSARWGGEARVVVVDLGHKDDKNAAPYEVAEIDAARDALAYVDNVAPLYLERFEETHPGMLPRLYPYSPKHFLLRHELDELFDTTPDLSGADVDVSRFIRSGAERDVQVFWADVPKDARQINKQQQPQRDELCAVPFLRAREWLFGSAATETRKFSGQKATWVWDWLDGGWQKATAKDVYPGRILLVPRACGGYDTDRGFDPTARKLVDAVLPQELPKEVTEAAQADASEDGEDLSESPWQTIATHGAEVGRLVGGIAAVLVPSLTSLLSAAGRWHDAGKGHPAFRGSIQARDEPYASRRDLAKAPQEAWLPRKRLYSMYDEEGKLIEQRQGFRHELASTLMLFDVLHRHQPDHPAMLGPWRELLKQVGMAPPQSAAAVVPPNAVECEILALDANQFDLLTWLVCAHHGKVRMAWHASPKDQQARSEVLRIRGIVDADRIPPVPLIDAQGNLHVLPQSRLRLAPAAAGLNSITGRGWTERVLGLLEHFGPFTLAWLEALLIAADRRASRRRIVDPLLKKNTEQGT